MLRPPARGQMRDLRRLRVIHVGVEVRRYASAGPLCPEVRSTSRSTAASSPHEFETLVLGEIEVVLDVQSGQRQLTMQQAATQLSLIGRGRPRSLAAAWMSPQSLAESTEELRITTLRKNARSPARRAGPQRCRCVHWVSSPTVTNVIASCRPASKRSRCSGSRSLRIAETTSVSRTTAVRRCRRAEMSRGRRGTLRTLRPTRTGRAEPGPRWT